MSAVETSSPESAVVTAAVPTQELETSDTIASPARGRGRPSKVKGNCTRAGCAEPEMCAGLCRRCYHQEYNQRKKTDVKDKETVREGGESSSSRSAKRQRRRSVSKGPFTTADNQMIDTPYIVEVALNARTKCQVCKQKITREELRIGVLRSKSSNNAPGLCRWYHPRCFEVPADFSLRRLHGRKKLGHADRASLKHILNKKQHKHHRDHPKDRVDRGRSHVRGSGDLTPTKNKKKHRTQKDKKQHKTHKKDTAPVYQNDSSSDSSSYSDVDDFDDEEAEESYESSDSSGADSGSSDEEYNYGRR